MEFKKLNEYFDKERNKLNFFEEITKLLNRYEYETQEQRFKVITEYMELAFNTENITVEENKILKALKSMKEHDIELLKATKELIKDVQDHGDKITRCVDNFNYNFNK